MLQPSTGECSELRTFRMESLNIVKATGRNEKLSTDGTASCYSILFSIIIQFHYGNRSLFELISFHDFEHFFHFRNTFPNNIYYCNNWATFSAFVETNLPGNHIREHSSHWISKCFVFKRILCPTLVAISFSTKIVRMIVPVKLLQRSCQNVSVISSLSLIVWPGDHKRKDESEYQ